MSELINIFPAITEKQYFQNSETKEFWFHATAVCNELGFKNPGRTLDMYCDDDEKFQEIVNGRVVWFVSEAGCYGLAMAAKTEAAKKFKRWLKHDVLPKLRTSGYYLPSDAPSKILEAAKEEIASIEKERYFYANQLSDAKKQLANADLMADQFFDYLMELNNFANELVTDLSSMSRNPTLTQIKQEQGLRCLQNAFSFIRKHSATINKLSMYTGSFENTGLQKIESMIRYLAQN